MNAAWGGISEMHEISICISEGHKTTANILKRKAFTVSMAEAGQVVACDYVGIVSGNKVSDKSDCNLRKLLLISISYHPKRHYLPFYPLPGNRY